MIVSTALHPDKLADDRGRDRVAAATRRGVRRWVDEDGTLLEVLSLTYVVGRPVVTLRVDGDPRVARCFALMTAGWLPLELA